jgi:hypothetical protein
MKGEIVVMHTDYYNQAITPSTISWKELEIQF